MIERTLNSLASDDPDAALRRIWDLAGDTFKYYYRHDTSGRVHQGRETNLG